jgi:hypothetical protein
MMKLQKQHGIEKWRLKGKKNSHNKMIQLTLERKKEDAELTSAPRAEK